MATHPLHSFSGFPPAAKRRFPKGYVRVLTGTACSQNCSTCPFSHDTDRNYRSVSEVRSVLSEAVRRRARGVMFGGGEPSLHPEILSLVLEASAQGLDVGMVSNGTGLTDPMVRADLVLAGLGRVHFHIFSADSELHESIAGAEADLEASLGAIKSFAQQDVDVLVVVPLISENLSGVPALVDKLASLSVTHVHFTVPDHIQAPWTRASWKEISAVVIDALADERFPRLSYDRIPLCFVEGHLPFYLRVAHRDPIPHPPESSDAISWLCRDCAARGQCESPAPSKIEMAAALDLRPFLERVSNSFNYMPKGVVAECSSLEDCPIRAGEVDPPDLDPDLDLLIFPNKKLMWVGSDTVNFRPEEVRRIRDESGQVYLDLSSKVLLDDFEADLAPLRKNPICETCPQLGPCPGAYSVVTLREGFKASQDRLNTILSGMRGRVLDVGVGEPHSLAPFFRHWKKAGGQEHAEISYVGLEPERRRIMDLRVRHPELDLREMAAESSELISDLDVGETGFDHILLLRSYNHLSDLYAAFENLCRLLNPGGTMLIAENTSFGLVRSSVQLRNLESYEREGAAPFEHYRNHTSAEALSVMAAFDLEILEHHPVSLATANQWILWLKKN